MAAVKVKMKKNQSKPLYFVVYNAQMCVCVCHLQQTCRNTGTLQARLALSGNKENTQSKLRKQTDSVYDAFSKQAQQITKLWPFTFSNSQRPPLAGLYTTRIYKQYKGLTAVSKRRLSVCVIDTGFTDVITVTIILHFKLLAPPGGLNVDRRCSSQKSKRKHLSICFVLANLNIKFLRETEANTPTVFPSAWHRTNSEELPQSSS